MDTLLERLENDTDSFLEDTHNVSVLRSALSDLKTRTHSHISNNKGQKLDKKDGKVVKFEDELDYGTEVMDDQGLETLLDDLQTLVKDMEITGELTTGEINILGSESEDEYQTNSEEEEGDSDDVMENLDPKEELRRLMEPVENTDGSDTYMEDDDDDYSDGEEESEESEKGDFDKVPKKNRDLLSEEDSSEGEDDLTPFQKQQLKLREQITKLENQQLDPKSWTMLGEVNARSRPINSLLEEHVEFDQSLGLNAGTSRLGPPITEETTNSLEDMIINRIKNHAFDDVELRYEVTDPNTRDQDAKNTELQHDSTNKSLAQVYEDEYARARQTISTLPDQGNAIKLFTTNTDATSAELQVKIRDRFNNICKSLDALSETVFTKHRVYSIDQSEIVIKSLPIEKVQK